MTERRDAAYASNNHSMQEFFGQTGTTLFAGCCAESCALARIERPSQRGAAIIKQNRPHRRSDRAWIMPMPCAFDRGASRATLAALVSEAAKAAGLKDGSRNGAPS
jgi:hypothetical protein